MIIDELYQDVILEHNNNPTNYRRIKNATHYSKGYNPFCGDYIEIFCNIQKKVIEEVSFFGEGCAISKASASIMMNLIEKKTTREALEIFSMFHKFLMNKKSVLNLHSKELKIFEGVKKFPLRIKCATLAWHTLRSAIK
jgi:nitrogen fixation NifU-like protein